MKTKLMILAVTVCVGSTLTIDVQAARDESVAQAQDTNRFAGGTFWRQRPGSRENSLMGPPVDLMMEPEFVGPPLERARADLFDEPVAAIEVPAASGEQRSESRPQTAPATDKPTPSADESPDTTPAPIRIAGLETPPEWPEQPDEYPDEGDEGDEGELPEPTQIPEPTTLLLIGAGLAAMALGHRRKRRSLRAPALGKHAA